MTVLLKLVVLITCILIWFLNDLYLLPFCFFFFNMMRLAFYFSFFGLIAGTVSTSFSSIFSDVPILCWKSGIFCFGSPDADSIENFGILIVGFVDEDDSDEHVVCDYWRKMWAYEWVINRKFIDGSCIFTLTGKGLSDGFNLLNFNAVSGKSLAITKLLFLCFIVSFLKCTKLVGSNFPFFLFRDVISFGLIFFGVLLWPEVSFSTFPCDFSLWIFITFLIWHFPKLSKFLMCPLSDSSS